MQLPTAKEACYFYGRVSFEKRKPYILDDQKKDFLHDFHLLQTCLFSFLFPPLRKKNICKKPVPHSVEEMKGKRDWFIYRPCHCHSVLGHPVNFSVRFVFGLELAVPSWKWSRFLCRPKSIGTTWPTNIFLKLYSYFKTVIILHHFNNWKLDNSFLWKQRVIRNSSLILKHYLIPLWHFIQERKRGATQHHSQDRVVAAA